MFIYSFSFIFAQPKIESFIIWSYYYYYYFILFFFAAFKHPIDAKDKNTPLTSSYSDIALDYQTRPVSVEKLFILRGLTSSWQYWCYERVFSSSKSCLFELLININAVWISYRMHDCQLLCIIYLEFLFLYTGCLPWTTLCFLGLYKCVRMI